MSDPGKAAYVNAMTACALIEMAAMQAHNAALARGISYDGHGAYSPAQFLDLIEKYGIHHNAVLDSLRP